MGEKRAVTNIIGAMGKSGEACTTFFCEYDGSMFNFEKIKSVFGKKFSDGLNEKAILHIAFQTIVEPRQKPCIDGTEKYVGLTVLNLNGTVRCIATDAYITGYLSELEAHLLNDDDNEFIRQRKAVIQ